MGNVLIYLAYPISLPPLKAKLNLRFDIQLVPRSKHSAFAVIKKIQLIRHKEIVCSGIHTNI